MSDDLESQPLMRMNVAAALAKEYTADQVGFFRSLARTLEASLPSETTIKHRGFFGNKAIASLTLALGEDRYGLAEDKGRLSATRTHISRGIALKTEEISVEEWIRAVQDGLQALAAKHAGAERALRELMGG